MAVGDILMVSPGGLPATPEPPLRGIVQTDTGGTFPQEVLWENGRRSLVSVAAGTKQIQVASIADTVAFVTKTVELPSNNVATRSRGQVVGVFLDVVDAMPWVVVRRYSDGLYYNLPASAVRVVPAA